MSIITRCQRGTCVYWPPGSEASSQGRNYDDYGKPLYGDPVEMTCRWDGISKEFIDPKGDRQVSNSIVITQYETKVGGVLFNGTLAEATDLDNPKNNEDAWEIKQVQNTPNLRYTEYLYRAYL